MICSHCSHIDSLCSSEFQEAENHIDHVEKYISPPSLVHARNGSHAGKLVTISCSLCLHKMKSIIDSSFCGLAPMNVFHGVALYVLVAYCLNRHCTSLFPTKREGGGGINSLLSRDHPFSSSWNRGKKIVLCAPDQLFLVLVPISFHPGTHTTLNPFFRWDQRISLSQISFFIVAHENATQDGDVIATPC